MVGEVEGTRSDYPVNSVEAARRVLIELFHVLGEYHDDIVIIGGWVPELLFPEAAVRHTGSLDVDLALNHRTLQDQGYRTIAEYLARGGYYRDPEDQPFQYSRKVRMADGEIVVRVDLLSGPYEGTAKRHRHQNVQGVQPRKVLGCDLAFELWSEVSLTGRLPDGTPDTVTLRVAGLVPFLALKANALAQRDVAKDAWDIDFCLAHCPGGLDGLAEELRPHLERDFVSAALRKLAAKFGSASDYGPSRVADFDELTDSDERAIRQQDAYQRVHYLLERLGLA